MPPALRTGWLPFHPGLPPVKVLGRLRARAVFGRGDYDQGRAAPDIDPRPIVVSLGDNAKNGISRFEACRSRGSIKQTWAGSSSTATVSLCKLAR